MPKVFRRFFSFLLDHNLHGLLLAAAFAALLVTGSSAEASSPSMSAAYVERFGVNLTGEYRKGIPFARWKKENEYTSNAQRANFRTVTGGSLGDNALYRSRIPDKDTEAGRLADLLAEDAGVRYIINLAESYPEIRAKMKKASYSSYYYRRVYRAGRVKSAPASVDVSGTTKLKANRRAMAAAFRTIASGKGPYLVHDTTGRDLTGEFCVIAQSLMGASYSQILNDYMRSYLNYGYRSSRSKALSFCQKNLDFLFQLITYCPSGSSWKTMNLSSKAARFLRHGGLTASEVSTIKKNLKRNYPSGTRTRNGNYYFMVDLVDGVTGRVFATRKVPFGGDVSLPAAPAHDGYTFTGWSPSGRDIQEDGAVTAVYRSRSDQAYGKNISGKYVSKTPFSRLKTGNEFTTNAMLANFRSVTAGSIGKNVLFRSKMPDKISNSGRVADLMMKDAGVKYVVNFNETQAMLSQRFTEEDYSSYYYYELFRKGRVNANRMSINFETESAALSNRKAIISAFKTIAEHTGPYLIHCIAGKDRTGEFCVIAEALMGASYSEILDDYMESFLNGGYMSTRAGALPRCRRNLDYLLQVMTYYPSGSNWRQLDLALLAQRYLKDGGLTDGQVLKIRRHLRASFPNPQRTKNGNYYFNVKLKDGLTGNVFRTLKVAYGKNASLSNPPKHSGYEFSSWSGTGKAVKKDMTIVAVYQKVPDESSRAS